MENKWWVKHEFNPEEPECVRCGKTMRLNDEHEWDDEEAYNLCWECLVEVLKEDEKAISFLKTSATLSSSPVIGFCKECSATLSHDNKIKGYSVLYECPVCGQPHSIDEILPVGTLESTYYTEQEKPEDTHDLCVNGDFNSFFPLHPVVTTRTISMKHEG